METEIRKNKGENTQITFKTSSPEERKRIEEKAAKFKMSISEYCRIKLLSDNDATLRALSRVAELEQQIKALRIELDNYQDTQHNPNDIVLHVTPQQKKVLDALSCDFEGASFGERIRDRLFFYLKNDYRNISDSFWDKIGITEDEMLDAFYPEDREDDY